VILQRVTRLRQRVLSWLIVLVCSSPSASLADQSDFQGWFQASGVVSLDHSKRYQLFLEVQPRVGANWERFDRLFIRPALTYNLRSDLGVSLGYLWGPGFLDTELHRDFREEHRVWQQLVFRDERGYLQWQHRVRPEARFIEDVQGTAVRLRYMLRGSYQLFPESGAGVTSFDELFIACNSIENGPHAGYDRNRFFVGPFWKREVVRYEVGYLVEHVQRFGDDQRWVHAIWSAISFEL